MTRGSELVSNSLRDSLVGGVIGAALGAAAATFVFSVTSAEVDRLPSRDEASLEASIRALTETLQRGRSDAGARPPTRSASRNPHTAPSASMTELTKALKSLEDRLETLLERKETAPTTVGSAYPVWNPVPRLDAPMKTDAIQLMSGREKAECSIELAGATYDDIVRRYGTPSSVNGDMRDGGACWHFQAAQIGTLSVYFRSGRVTQALFAPCDD